MSPIWQLPFGQGKKWATEGAAAAILGDWTLSSIIAFESGFPVSLSSNSNNLSQGFFLKQYPNLTGGDVGTDGSRDERIYTGENPGLWLNPAGAVNGALYQLGDAPRTLDDVRTPHRNNWDFVATKDIRLGSTARAQVRFEVLNITNTVKTAGPTTAVGSTTYGRITTQRGFMRLTQLMFRINF
jgi:trimeric autotransporter adhesin